MGEALLWSLLGIVVLQALFFVYAAGRKTDSVTDLAYAGTFALVALVGLLFSDYSVLHIIFACMIFVWAVRLGGYLYVRIHKIGTDARFDGVREDPKKFAGFWFFQAVTIFVVSLPIVFLLTTSLPPVIPWITIIGFLVWLCGILIETVADAEKYQFYNKQKRPSKWIQTGLWKHARHPNYFGEMLCWIGVFLFVAPFLSGWWWLTILSPLYVIWILRFISGIPPLEKKMQERYGKTKEYKEYLKRTRLLVPLPKK